MRILLLFVLSSLLSLSVNFSYAANLKNLSDAALGTHYDVFRKNLFDSYNLKKFGQASSYLPEKSTYSFAFAYFSPNRDFVHINGYLLGKKTINLHLAFDEQRILYRIKFESEKYSADNFNKFVMEDAVYISQYLAQEFGAPSQKYTPALGDIRPGYDRYFWQWRNQPYRIYTAVAQQNGEYYAKGIIDSSLFIPKTAPKAVTVE